MEKLNVSYGQLVMFNFLLYCWQECADYWDLCLNAISFFFIRGWQKSKISALLGIGVPSIENCR